MLELGNLERYSRRELGNILLVITGSVLTAIGGSLLTAGFPTAPSTLDMGRQVLSFTILGVLPWIVFVSETPEATVITTYLIFLGMIIPISLITGEMLIRAFDVLGFAGGFAIAAAIWYTSDTPVRYMALLAWQLILLCYLATVGYLFTTLGQSAVTRSLLVFLFITAVVALTHQSFLRERIETLDRGWSEG